MRRLFLAVTMLAMLTFFAGCSKPSEPATTTDANGNTQQANNGTANGGSAMNGTKAAPPAGMKPAGAVNAGPTVVPAGTVLTVRLGETLGSKASSSGQGFSATLAEPLMIDGKEVAPRGAAAAGTVVDAQPLGKFKGGAKLDLRLTSLTLNGQQVAVNTSIVDRQIKGKGKRSAVMIGGGAGLGALIGGLAGGGKGAAIGAGAGAAAGTGGTYFTGNKEIVLPAETALSFKLKDSVTLK
jgi:hypothetical protein